MGTQLDLEDNDNTTRNMSSYPISHQVHGASALLITHRKLQDTFRRRQWLLKPISARAPPERNVRHTARLLLFCLIVRRECENFKTWPSRNVLRGPPRLIYVSGDLIDPLHFTNAKTTHHLVGWWCVAEMTTTFLNRLKLGSRNCPLSTLSTPPRRASVFL